jgi:hypothetical protein
MRLIRWIRALRYSGHDSSGDAKFLIGRAVDPAQCNIEGVPPEVRDEALKLLCESFDIPQRQMYCLRADDELLAIYRSFVGPRPFDELQFENLWLSLDELPGPKVSPEEMETIKTVSDVARAVAARRRAATGRRGPAQAP